MTAKWKNGMNEWQWTLYNNSLIQYITQWTNHNHEMLLSNKNNLKYWLAIAITVNL